jgi:putative endonuclease
MRPTAGRPVSARPTAEPAAPAPSTQVPSTRAHSSGGRSAAGRSAAGRELGRAGEAMAADWYTARGYDVLARNWRCRAGELDLVVARGRFVVFCEVKARSSDRFGLPAEAVTRDKQMRIRRLAARWIEEAAPGRPRAIRFDVACVIDGGIEVLEGAF